MAIEPRRRKAKWAHCHHLIGGSEIIALQETHSTTANTARLILPRSHTFWWSHDTQQTAGIAVWGGYHPTEEIMPADRGSAR